MLKQSMMHAHFPNFDQNVIGIDIFKISRSGHTINKGTSRIHVPNSKNVIENVRMLMMMRPQTSNLGTECRDSFAFTISHACQQAHLEGGRHSSPSLGVLHCLGLGLVAMADRICC